MKKTFFITLLTILSNLMVCASATNPSVLWQKLENPADSTGRTYIQRFKIKNSAGINRLCFNMFGRTMKTLDPADTLIEIMPGYYAIDSERFGKTDSEIVIDMTVRGRIETLAYRPDGFHAVTRYNQVIPVETEWISLLETTPAARPKMLPADSIFRLNERLRADRTPVGPFDIIPSFKNVVPADSGTYKKGDPISTNLIGSDKREFYRITLSNGNALIEAVDKPTTAMAQRVLENLLENNGGELPAAVIEDYPDFPYRGVMIDIARNNQSYGNIRDLMRQLANYRFNVLHFHLVDDEAWRLEIPGLPELTEVGARRGYTLDDSAFLKQLYSGNGNPDTPEGASNGYITRRQFIELLRYCDSLGIHVIPEIESPGHARAAIKAMEARYRNTGDDTFRMIEDGDTSRYTTAQAYHDNLMNPALNGTYRFMEKVIDEIAAMYTEAGVELPGINIGGDEVPEGAWDGSAAANELARQLGVSGRHALQGEYVRRIAKMFAQKGIKMFGWQEIGKGYDNGFNSMVAPAVGGVYCWTSAYNKRDGNLAHTVLRGGYPIVLCNVDYLYLDQIYQQHPDENGLSWGGIVDEFRTLNAYPSILCPPLTDAPGTVIGMQGNLFAETIRGYSDIQNLLFPKMLGLAERAWNNNPTYSDARFNQVVEKVEMPRWEKQEIRFHLRQPGIKMENGKIVMNSPYSGAEIRFTTDGTEPDCKSQLYISPFAPGTAKEIRAKLFFHNRRSLSSVVNFE